MKREKFIFIKIIASILIFVCLSESVVIQPSLTVMAKDKNIIEQGKDFFIGKVLKPTVSNFVSELSPSQYSYFGTKIEDNVAYAEETFYIAIDYTNAMERGTQQSVINGYLDKWGKDVISSGMAELCDDMLQDASELIENSGFSLGKLSDALTNIGNQINQYKRIISDKSDGDKTQNTSQTVDVSPVSPKQEYQTVMDIDQKKINSKIMDDILDKKIARENQEASDYKSSSSDNEDKKTVTKDYTKKEDDKDASQNTDEVIESNKSSESAKASDDGNQKDETAQGLNKDSDIPVGMFISNEYLDVSNWVGLTPEELKKKNYKIDEYEGVLYYYDSNKVIKEAYIENESLNALGIRPGTDISIATQKLEKNGWKEEGWGIEYPTEVRDKKRAIEKQYSLGADADGKVYVTVDSVTYTKGAYGINIFCAYYAEGTEKYNAEQKRVQQENSKQSNGADSYSDENIFEGNGTSSITMSHDPNILGICYYILD